MTYAETLLPEFDREMANTRKVLERIPRQKLDWKPHPKSHTIGWNANHLAEIAGWVVMALTPPSLDFAPVDGPKYESPTLTSRQEILDLFDRNVAAARRAIAAAKDEQMGQSWSLSRPASVLTMPRAAVVRCFVLNHLIHHRAILCVYLRLNDIPVPGMYGPSGDGRRPHGKSHRNPRHSRRAPRTASRSPTNEKDSLGSTRLRVHPDSLMLRRGSTARRRPGTNTDVGHEWQSRRRMTETCVIPAVPVSWHEVRGRGSAIRRKGRRPRVRAARS